ncbi:MAG: hypothetical protein R2856_04415 [Caldilineaceae bacterium]
MKQAQLQMDQSLTALATVYSQVRLIDAQDVASGKAERLSADIQEQVNRLNDQPVSTRFITIRRKEWGSWGSGTRIGD